MSLKPAFVGAASTQQHTNCASGCNSGTFLDWTHAASAGPAFGSSGNRWLQFTDSYWRHKFGAGPSVSRRELNVSIGNSSIDAIAVTAPIVIPHHNPGLLPTGAFSPHDSSGSGFLLPAFDSSSGGAHAGGGNNSTQHMRSSAQAPAAALSTPAAAALGMREAAAGGGSGGGGSGGGCGGHGGVGVAACSSRRPQRSSSGGRILQPVSEQKPQWSGLSCLDSSHCSSGSSPAPSSSLGRSVDSSGVLSNVDSRDQQRNVSNGLLWTELGGLCEKHQSNVSNVSLRVVAV
ncbi:hypothetical protein JKP88DRAFT_289955 [Tribonema minus]|uniref:Uncharacterized protein n=1 Tax=Tribonema minus TaxID=303371 RepID=A0A835YYV4_9STRA|nr:hypothetical protein JKP88DRAFT_289955 [Tribonema minus]